MKAKRVVVDKEFLLEGHEERLTSINTNLQGIKRDMLLIVNYGNLGGRAASLKEASFELRVAIKRLLRSIKAESTISRDTGLSGVSCLKSFFPLLMAKS